MSAEREQGPGPPLLARRDAKGDLDAMDEMLAPDFVDHTYFQAKNPAAKASSEQSPSIMPPSPTPSFIIEEQIAEGDKVVTRFSGSATHDRGSYGRRAYRQRR